MSEVPPGTKGTTNRMDLDGHVDWATLGQGLAIAADASAAWVSSFLR